MPYRMHTRLCNEINVRSEEVTLSISISSVLARLSFGAVSDAGVLAFLFSDVPFVPLVYTAGISDGVGGLNEAVAGSVGSKVHSWCSRRLNGVLQFVVIAFPLQCASTSE